MLPRAIELGRQALWLALTLSLPAMAVGALVGLVVATLTRAVGAGDPAVQHLPRAMAVGAAVAFGGAWMAHGLVRFAHGLWSALPAWVS